MAELPSGAVSFLFTDIENSTRLVKQLRERWAEVLSEHQRLLREAFLNHQGHEVDTQGDSFFVVFASAREALLAAVEGQRAVLSQRWPDGVQVKVRMGIHTGQAITSDGRYTGLAVHRAARVGAAGHGGQVLVSHATQTLLEDEEEDLDVFLRDLGEQRLKGLDRPVRLYQVEAPGLPTAFPPLRHEAELAQAAEAALAGRLLPRRRLVLAGLVLGVAAAVAVGVLLLTSGEAAVTVRPNSVAVIDPKKNKVIRDVPVGSGPGPITAGGDAIWVANQDDQTISRLNPATQSVTRYISLGRTPTGLAYGAGALWVANGLLGTVQEIDPEFNTPGAPIDTDAGRAFTGSIAVGFDSIFFASANSVVQRLDPQTRKVTATLFSGLSPSAIAVNNDAIWVANQASNDVYEFSPMTNQPVAKPAVAAGPTAITTGGGWVWVAVGQFNTVVRIDPLSLAQVSIPVGQSPSAIAYGADAVWVANAGDGTVSRIDPTRTHVTKKITVGSRPEGIAVADNRVWVTVQSP